MCFTRLNLKPSQVALDNIICYKILRKDTKTIRSPYRRKYKWDDKKVRKTKFDSSSPFFSITMGFHSFIDIKKAIRYGRRIFRKEDCYIYKLIIPKGARYYKNRTQYVSNKIRLASKTPIQPLLKKK